VFDRLREAGDRGVVVVAKDPLTELALCAPASPARLEVAHEQGDLVRIDGDALVDMFFACLRGAGVLVVERLAARLIESPELQNV
jgi:hypothetical protein